MKNKKQFVTALAVLIMTLMLTSSITGAISSEFFSDDANEILENIAVLGLTSEEFSSMPTDGEVQRIEYCGFGGAPYEDIRARKEGNHLFSDKEFLCVGQDFIGPPAATWDCGVYRDFLFFDTNSLPNNAVIHSAYLDLCGRKKSEMDENFDIYVQKCTSSHPSMPLKLDDYYYLYYQPSGNGAETFNTQNFQHSETQAKHNFINLNSAGLSWINLEGVTKFCLRSSRDFDSKWDGGNEWVSIWSSEKGGEYTPKLVISYNIAPTAHIDSINPSNPTRNEEVVMTGHGEDDEEIIAYKWLDGNTEIGTSETCIVKLSAGDHTIKLQVQDSSGDWSQFDTESITVSENEAPDFNSIEGPSSGKARKMYTFTLVANDKNDDKVKFEIQWGDDESETTSYCCSGSEVKVSHEYMLSNAYTIKARAIDENYESSSDWVEKSFSTKTAKPLTNTLWLRLIQENFPTLFNLLEKLGF